jgi:hypothetical protein
VPKRFCSARCRNAATSERRRQKAANGELDQLDPEHDVVWQRPLYVPADELSDKVEALSLPKMPWEQATS